MAAIIGLIFALFIIYHPTSQQLLLRNIHSQKTIVQGKNFSISIMISLSTNLAVINMTGPDSNWFGIGFNSQVMNDTYSIVCSSNHSKYYVQENKLAKEEVGIQLKPMIQVLNDYTQSGVRTVYMQRKRQITPNDTGDYIDYYTFPASPTLIYIIYSTGTTSDFGSSSDMDIYGSTTLEFK